MISDSQSESNAEFDGSSVVLKNVDGKCSRLNSLPSATAVGSGKEAMVERYSSSHFYNVDDTNMSRQLTAKEWVTHIAWGEQRGVRSQRCLVKDFLT